MNKQALIQKACNFLENCEDNYLKPEIAIEDRMAGMRIYEAPLFGFGVAQDEHFVLLKKEDAVGDHFMLPQDWLPEARTVISFFLPYTDAVRNSNRSEMRWPSGEWLHGRIEGQKVLNKLTKFLQDELIAAGFASIAPPLDERIWSKQKPDDNDKYSFTSNWSERHVAFVCGLGTFGLSRGLITEKGMAGRFGSVITELALSPTERKYEDVYEYCTLCGGCIRQCPVGAISFDEGKDHTICCDFLDVVKERFAPRYGCGKCQVGVPCETGIPG
ncbi:MAG: epoxyqueuosine reductase [Firmicutes bacterium]|nr:epoxyqueuosine reductase [Bacillota bacterium]